MYKIIVIIALFLSEIAVAGAYGDDSTSTGHRYRDSLSAATYDCVLREAWETPKAPIPFARLDFSRVLHLDWHYLMLLRELLSPREEKVQ